MNARLAKQRREAEEREFRAEVIGLVNAQKAVLGALARTLTAAQKHLQHLDERLTILEQDPGTIQ